MDETYPADFTEATHLETRISNVRMGENIGMAFYLGERVRNMKTSIYL